jgi:excisionase family DNA binding protein
MTTCNINEAARLLKVHEETVAEMIRSHKIPAAKIGRAWVMLERDLVEYIERQIQLQTAERLGRRSPQVRRQRRAA